MKIMGTDKTNTFFVGDQLFTDVWGAKRTGIHNIINIICPNLLIEHFYSFFLIIRNETGGKSNLFQSPKQLEEK